MLFLLDPDTNEVDAIIMPSRWLWYAQHLNISDDIWHVRFAVDKFCVGGTIDELLHKIGQRLGRSPKTFKLVFAT